MRFEVNLQVDVTALLIVMITAIAGAIMVDGMCNGNNGVPYKMREPTAVIDLDETDDGENNKE